jgi:titin
MGARNNTIGGDTPAERNVISGNGLDGVGIYGDGTMTNTVTGNYIGTRGTGVIAMGNLYQGVHVYGGATGNIIGGEGVGERNVISGNVRNGVMLEGEDTSGNTVAGNYIGVAWNGLTDVGNVWDGVAVTGGAHDNTIGPGNILSGNGTDGVMLIHAGTERNLVIGNLIGTDHSGNVAVPNDVDGVYIGVSASNNTIGGPTARDRNIISGNGEEGILILGNNTSGNTITGNYIGTRADGAAALSNGMNGVFLNNADGNIVGPGNVLSGNDLNGVSLITSDDSGIFGNHIGLNAPGDAALGNGAMGVYMYGHATNNIIGGTTTGERNLISGNLASGIQIALSHSNTVIGNFIGTDITGELDLGNTRYGINIRGGAQNNAVGGNTPAERNLISGNGFGISLTGVDTYSNTVSGNYIGTDVDGLEDLGNDSYGVFIYEFARSNMIGGDSAGEGNLISNNLSGVFLNLADGGWNSVINNSIGLDAAGNVIGNDRYGIYIGGTRMATVEKIGMSLINGSQMTSSNLDDFYTWIEGNTIAGHGSDGILIGGCDGNFITQNSIYQNDESGILIGAGNGGIDPPTIVSTSLDGGVLISGTACHGCTVEFFENPDNDGEGQTHIGSAVADGAGVFELTVNYLNYPFLTATATDYTLVPEFGIGTSEFSPVFTSTILGYLYLPLIEND